MFSRGHEPCSLGGMAVSVELRTLYYLSRAGVLSAPERDRYRTQRAGLFAHLLAQQASGYASRRRSPRVPRALEVRLRDGSVVATGHTLQISAGGFSMYLERPLVAESLECRLYLPQSLHLDAPVRVVGCVQHGDGAFFVCFAFIDLFEYERRLLEEVLVDATIENAFEQRRGSFQP